MNLFITNINGMGGTAYIAQSNVTKIAREIGFREINFYIFNTNYDTDNDLNHRMDGIIAPLCHSDIVVLQWPTWNDLRYDNNFINHIKSYKEVKLIIFCQDINSLMFNVGGRQLEYEIDILNRADLLIMPSEKMHNILKAKGLKDIPVIYQTVWDYMTDARYERHSPIKRMFFTGNPSRFPFVNSYNGKTLLCVYDGEKPSRENDESFVWRGYRNFDALNMEVSEGGFGLVWSDDDYFERYYSMNQPYKLGCFLLSGIPVIVRKGCTHEEFVKKNKIGYVVESLEEADELIQNTTNEEFEKLYRNVKRIQQLIATGAYTREALQKAIIRVVENSIE